MAQPTNSFKPTTGQPAGPAKSAGWSRAALRRQLRDAERESEALRRQNERLERQVEESQKQIRDKDKALIELPPIQAISLSINAPKFSARTVEKAHGRRFGQSFWISPVPN